MQNEKNFINITYLHFSKFVYKKHNFTKNINCSTFSKTVIPYKNAIWTVLKMLATTFVKQQNMIVIST